MSTVHTDKFQRFAGSLTAIILEVTGIFLVALFDFLFAGQQRHMIAVAALLVLLVITFSSLYLHARHMRGKGIEVLIDNLADDLANRLTEVLESAIAEKWGTAAEEEMCRLEADEKVREVWILGGDLAADLGCRRGTILDCLSAGKRYRYICPHDERPWKQLHNLWHLAADHVPSFKPEQLEMKCLPGRKLPAVQLVILQPPGSVHLFLQTATADRRVLTVPSASKLVRDVATGFNSLWHRLPLVPHTETERLAH